MRKTLSFVNKYTMKLIRFLVFLFVITPLYTYSQVYCSHTAKNNAILESVTITTIDPELEFCFDLTPVAFDEMGPDFVYNEYCVNVVDITRSDSLMMIELLLEHVKWDSIICNNIDVRAKIILLYSINNVKVSNTIYLNKLIMYNSLTKKYAFVPDALNDYIWNFRQNSIRSIPTPKDL